MRERRLAGMFSPPCKGLRAQGREEACSALHGLSRMAVFPFNGGGAGHVGRGAETGKSASRVLAFTHGRIVLKGSEQVMLSSR